MAQIPAGGDPVLSPMAASAGLVKDLMTSQPVAEILAAGHAADLVCPGMRLGPLDADKGWRSVRTGIESRSGELYVRELGYLHTVDGCLQVVSSVIIATDASEAHLLCLRAQRAGLNCRPSGCWRRCRRLVSVTG
jgi:hypothetical protein